MRRLFAFFLSVSVLFMSVCPDMYAGKRDKNPKYIFLFIGDGMGMTHVAAAESYLTYKNGSDAGLIMCSFPYFGFCSNASSDADITDSSAAATAIACGEKTNNGFLGVDAEGNPLRSVAYDLKDRGYQIGILSNVPVNHATPASFYASSRARSDYYSISQQIASTGFDFFAGSGFLNVTGRKKDKEPIDKWLEGQGYPVCYGVEEFSDEADRTDRIIFCQASSRIDGAGNYVSDGKDVEDVSLGTMLEIGLDFVDDDKPFFFMCEGGNIDWAAHDNKTMTTVMEVVAFDKAIREAIEFYNEHPEETLIIVTADHETGGVSIGEGKDWRPEIIDWPMLEKHWFESGEKNVLGYEENREMNKKALIGWTSSHHTAARVPAFAIGKGAEKFHGIIENTDIKGKILGE
jgi:alkaline phosphatase